MEFKIPKIYKKIELKDYAAEWEDQSLSVWINLPRSMVNEQFAWAEAYNELSKRINENNAKVFELGTKKAGRKDEISKLKTEIDQWMERKRELGEKLDEWYSKVFFDNGEPVTKESISELFRNAEDTDPQFKAWLQLQALTAIYDHRSAQKN